MADLYLVKDSTSVNLSPSGRVEETMTNDLYAKERGIGRNRRNRSKEETQDSWSTVRKFVAATGTCQTRYPILSVTAVWDNGAGTGTNYYTGGSFSFKTITLGSVGSLNDGDTLYIDYIGSSGDTIVVDSGRVRDNYLITGNLVSDANGSIASKKGDLKTIFNSGGNVALTYPSQNSSVNVFPTRMTFVENAGEIEQAEVMMEAIFGYDKT